VPTRGRDRGDARMRSRHFRASRDLWPHCSLREFNIRYVRSDVGGQQRLTNRTLERMARGGIVANPHLSRNDRLRITLIDRKPIISRITPERGDAANRLPSRRIGTWVADVCRLRCR